MLKSLDMFGFKSFADRTRFEFSTGITCVVGPNGSGKSNVVDAIKWVLGDQSPKSLRGKEMTDVIFNGNKTGRKPAAFAEVLLTFDNAERYLSVDNAEVQVGRRLWQSGDSEYLINGQPARLRDIKDLFLGTGAGSSAYSIIEQGRVDQILQSNAAARRHVFEEAAGVSRYKARKEEATRKLERVDQNLLRLRDIVDEVESQLNTTRSQASKAAKYREVSAELREWWLGLAADDHRHYSAHLAVVEEQLRVGEAELAEIVAKQTEVDRQLSAFDADLADVDLRLRNAERNAATNREGVVRQESTVRHLIARQRDLENELGRLRRQRTSLLGRSQEMSAEFQRHQGELAGSEAEFQRLGEEQTAADRGLEELTATLKRARAQLQHEQQKHIELQQQATAAAQRLESLRSQRESALAAVVSTVERLAQCDRDIVAAQADVLIRQSAVDAVLLDLASLDDRVRDIRDRQQQLRADHERCQQQLREQREDRSAKLSQQAVLEDLERRQEGLGIGVKEILSRAQSSDYAPWTSVLGSVADLLEADLDEAAILEVALGAQAQLIVVRELAPIVEYLGSGPNRISGRVGFIEVSDPKQMADGGRQMTELLPAGSGVIKRADQLVSLKCGVPGLAELLLSSTWVVDTLDTALKLSNGGGFGHRFVTLQGELLESDGTLFAGAVRSESALLTRRSELRRLKNDLQRLDRTIADGERQLSQLNQSLAGVEREIDTATSTKHELAERVALARSNVVSRRQDVERLNKDRDLILAESARLESLAGELVLSIDQADREQSWFEDNQRSVRETMLALESDVAQREQDRQALAKRQVDQRLQLAKHEERVQAARTACDRSRDELRQRDEQLEEADRRLTTATSQLRQITLQVLNTNAELWELNLQGERCSADVASVTVEKEQARTRRTALAELEAQLRQQRREIGDRLHVQEIAARDARHQLQVGAERIEEEYQLALDEVVASGASAFAKWQADGRRQMADGRRQMADGRWQMADGREVQSDDDIIANDLSRSDGNVDPTQCDQLSERDVDRVTGLPAARCPLPAEASFLDARPELEQRVNRLRRKLKMMGSVNTDSLKDLDELDARFQHLSSQLQDLDEAKATLEEILRQINVESRRLFLASFESIRQHFQQLFRKLFGGGEGDIILEDVNDVLDCGIDIVARPPGKELRSITLLSGGEKTMTAVALLMAIFRSKPSPFCILDEVDAALDEANVERYSGLIREFKQTTQFIMITHSKRSMQVADILYGVTMEQSGVSKRMSVRFEDVGEDGNFRVTPTAGSHAA